MGDENLETMIALTAHAIRLGQQVTQAFACLVLYIPVPRAD